MAEQHGRRADRAIAHPHEIDAVVGDEDVTALDDDEGALALADAARADEEKA